MKHPIVATTTSPYYLDKSMYCVKVLKVSKTKPGRYKWYVSKIIYFSIHRENCISEAMEIASKNDLIYVPFAKHQRPLTVTDIRRLESYGLLDR